MRKDPDVVVIGSGPNGLVAAGVLARRGLRVLVLEANAERPGGALASRELTRRGFVHDVGAGFFPLVRRSAAFQELDLARLGVLLEDAPFATAHPAPDGSVVAISPDLDRTLRTLRNARDAARWRSLVGWYLRSERDVLDALLLPVPAFRPWLRMGPAGAVRLARTLLSTGNRLARRNFESGAARRVLPSLAFHSDLSPDDRLGGGVGFILGMLAASAGFPVVRGGAQALTNALVTLLERDGGRLRLGARVERVVVCGGRASAVRLSDGSEIPAREAVLADTSATSLVLNLLSPDQRPAALVRKMRRFRPGLSTYKLDWALSGHVPWMSELARQSAVVHLADSLEDLARFAADLRAQRLPSHPYLVVGQQSLADPGRAPPGCQTLYAYTHVPSLPSWGDRALRFADAIEERIEELAPGFRATILERRITTPHDLERWSSNLAGGDIGGGSSHWYQQAIFRPAFPWFRYRMPIARLYLCSSYAHPGGGVHGMCGYNAAHTALRDLS